MTTITSVAEAQAFVSQFHRHVQGSIAALTGAGISTESGVPDFRSPGGIWSERAPVQYQDFVANRDSRLEDWTRRFEMASLFEKAKPNAAHVSLTAMCDEGTLKLLITQNVDGLHQRAGVPMDKLVELHGNSTYAECLSCGAEASISDQRKTVAALSSPRCVQCNGLLKAAVVSFGQKMPAEALEKAMSAARSCDVFLVLGSSLVVHPAAQLPLLAVESGAELVILNNQKTPLDSLASTVIRTPLAQTFAEFTVK